MLQIKRSKVALALATVFLALLAVSGVASAREKDRPGMQKGVYEGIWHTDKVTFIVEKVHGDGTFTGEIHFDPHGRFPDFRCGFTARLGEDDALTMTRTDCAQTAVTGKSERRGRANVWTGHVRGQYLDRPLPFELRIPAWR
jgi:hypothetical protein